MKKLILASTSPRRKQLLSQLGLSFTVMPSNYEEKMNPRLKTRGQAEFLSKEKAQAVALKYQDEEVVILAADSLIDYQGEAIGKPHSADEAKRILRKLSGNMHKAITAFTLIDTKTQKTTTKSAEANVYMKKLSKKEIDNYVATKEPLDRAGSYAIEGIGSIFIEKIEGDYYTVIGLPMQTLYEELKQFGITII